MNAFLAFPVLYRQFHTTDATANATDLPLLSDLDRMAGEQADRWLDVCRHFLRWYRQHFLLAEPADEDRAALNKALPWLIRHTRFLHAQLLDPDWPHHEEAENIQAVLWQLSEAWESVHNPMTDAEADAILAKVFPG